MPPDSFTATAALLIISLHDRNGCGRCPQSIFYGRLVMAIKEVPVTKEGLAKILKRQAESRQQRQENQQAK